jgi:ribosomal protein S18 acetylase RimI-like enzyme
VDITFSKPSVKEDKKIIEMYKTDYQNVPLAISGITEYLKNKTFPLYTIIAKDEDKVVGNLMWRVRGFTEVGQADLMELVVHKDYQGHGIGTRLLEKGVDDIMKYFKSHGTKATALLVTTDDDNEQGIKFYEKKGFKRIAHLGPLLRNEILYCLDLGED